jgi:hypothetical protein
MNHEKVIIKLFDYFYNKFYRTSQFLDIDDNVNKKLIQSFCKLLLREFPTLHSVGYGYLIRYFAYSFNHYGTCNLKYRIKLNWIIGKKMFSRFLQKKDTQDYYVQKFLTEYGIDIDMLISKLASEEHVETEVINRAEELEKLRHVGPAKLAHCTDHTTLYNNKSIHCLTCENKITCKKLLKKINPALFNKRGYG